MKINQDTYFCPWCSTEFKKNIERVEGAGRKGVGVSQCVCPKCFRLVSQKTKIELEAKNE